MTESWPRVTTGLVIDILSAMPKNAPVVVIGPAVEPTKPIWFTEPVSSTIWAVDCPIEKWPEGTWDIELLLIMLREFDPTKLLYLRSESGHTAPLQSLSMYRDGTVVLT